MSKDDNAIFPSKWGWRKYEPAFSELMNRLAQTQEATAPNGRLLNTGSSLTCTDYEGIKLNHWWERQVKEGRLPSDNLLLGMNGDLGRQLDNIFDQALARARLNLRSDQKTLTFFGQRPNLSSTYNPPSGELLPRNNNHFPAPDSGKGRRR